MSDKQKFWVVRWTKTTDYAMVVAAENQTHAENLAAPETRNPDCKHEIFSATTPPCATLLP